MYKKDNFVTLTPCTYSFDPSPYTRVTFWNAVVGGSVAMLGAFATNQATIQRYLSLPTLSDAKKCVNIQFKATTKNYIFDRWRTLRCHIMSKI